MHLQDLRDALASLPACHPGTPTNVLSVEMPHSDLIRLEVDTSALEEQIAELEEQNRDLSDQVVSAGNEADEAEAENRRVKAKLLEVEVVLNTLHANAAESPEWIRRVIDRAMHDLHSQ